MENPSRPFMITHEDFDIENKDFLSFVDAIRKVLKANNVPQAVTMKIFNRIQTIRNYILVDP